jgi:hypothetical protein
VPSRPPSTLAWRSATLQPGDPDAAELRKVRFLLRNGVAYAWKAGQPVWSAAIASVEKAAHSTWRKPAYRLHLVDGPTATVTHDCGCTS